jgi:hypothetical protein
MASLPQRAWFCRKLVMDRLRIDELDSARRDVLQASTRRSGVSSLNDLRGLH